MSAQAGEQPRAPAPLPKKEVDSKSKPVDFPTQIAPIFRRHCLRCHSGESAKSSFRLDNGPDALKGGNSGKSIEPGKSQASELIEKITSKDPESAMPPKDSPRVGPAEVALLRRWIDEGAKWPKGFVLEATESPQARAGRTHWAYQPVVKLPLPSVKNQNWIRNGIDAWILARLEQEKISPAPEATRRTLLRRVTIDLTGLPPTREELAEFLSDRRPDAYERAVDRLLASPAYGERWARLWLDLSHYGDSDGYLTDQLRPVAWRYRQWLVDAINLDLPFDQFTVQQLAGDLLPGSTVDQKIATGFLRQTLSNREGGADLEEYRVEQIVDRTSMVGSTWLGMTIGCARCHDHKYDPLTQKEFFEFYAFFNNADEVNIDAPLPGEREPYLQSLKSYRAEREKLVAPVRKELDRLQKQWEEKLLHAERHPGEDHRWDRAWEILGLIWGGHLGEGQLEGTEIVRIPWNRRRQDDHERLQEYFLQQGSLVDPKKYSELKLGTLAGNLLKLRKSLPPLSRAQTMRAAITPRPNTIHIRGMFRDRGIPVQSNTPRWLPKSGPSKGSGPPDRLDFARWIVSKQNPLTSRVAVNRYWQEFFGRGIVLTSGDFGTQGSPPSHPALLDWLAAEFRDGGWNVKQLHRLIVTSATYRQSSAARPDLAARDPQNVLLARQESLRFSAEAIRDAALAASGLLYRKLGGPSVMPPQPDVVVMEGFGENAWKTSAGPDRHRRGLYTFLLRTSPFAQMVTFDGPNLSRSCTRRERSNNSLQALTLLNDPVFFETAEALARRILAEGPADTSARIDFGFELCLGRLPTRGEKARLVGYLEELPSLPTNPHAQSQREKSTPAAGTLAKTKRSPAAKGKAGPNSVPTNSGELHRWTGLASVLLNLHEFITRD